MADNQSQPDVTMEEPSQPPVSVKDEEGKKKAATKSVTETKKSEKYDPLEADAEDDEEEMDNSVNEKTEAEVEKLLDDIDMDENPSTRNMLDDTGDDKIDEDENMPKVEQPQPVAVSKPAPRGRGGFYRQRGNRARRSRR